ncbi:peptidoglycan D,D-transpeptidase FtsI family protein [Roseixanthobacter glucoisosaccharinicivorans]|uniref:peptidoglycan D,D-transpeptidase FtsI family protein n=1 Tax=Roseixanthobacter glucoisosaccharinicivorans TaxID=3119923 RepID=UPI003727667D
MVAPTELLNRIDLSKVPAPVRAVGAFVGRLLRRVLGGIFLFFFNLQCRISHRVARIIFGTGIGLVRFVVGTVRFCFAFARGTVRALFGLDRVDAQTVTRARLQLLVAAFSLVFMVIAGRLVFMAITSDPQGTRGGGSEAVASARPDIIDRNGDIVAIDVKSPSLFAEPKRLIDPDEALEGLLKVLPDLDVADARARLNSGKGFAWLKREITPAQQRAIYRLGLPGIGFVRENRRIYPDGPTLSHVIGAVNVDNQGIAGLEKYIDGRGLAELHLAGFATDRQQEPVRLSVDVRVQHAMRDELMRAKDKFKAKAAMGVVTDVRTGEIISMVSLPDFDPNIGGDPRDNAYLNRLTTGVFEMGSTFKALSFAMALDSGKIGLNSTFDARGAMHFGRFAIHDYHAENRVLSVPEIFLVSSNVGTAKMVLSLGVDAHKAFLRKMGQLDRLRTELPESAEPIVPKRWGELNSATIAFGHGIAVAPLQAVMAVNSMMNGGYLIPPTFLKRSQEEAQKVAVRVMKPETSDKMRYLLRLNAEKGTATKAEVPGYYVGGKTGTAEKVVNGRYAKNKLLTSFTAVFPMDKPQYLVLVMIDEPQPLPETHGYATSGWNAAPTAGKIVERIAPMLGVMPRQNLPTADQMLGMARQKVADRQ